MLKAHFHSEGRIGAVLDVRRNAQWVHVTARARLCPYDLPTVVQAEQERSAFCIRQARDGLRQLPIIEVRLELRRQGLASTNEVAGLHAS